MLARKGEQVKLWTFEQELVDIVNQTRVNSWYLDGFAYPDTLQATNDMEEVLDGATMLVLVTPSQNMRAVLTPYADRIPKDIPIVCCSKGIEIATGQLMSDVLASVLPDHPTGNFTFLSGPSFAKEVAQEHPTAVVVAGTDEAIVTQVQQTFRTPFFMTFRHHDVAGVELGGALKNVMAIATGIVQGLGFGHNTQTALITRGLYEMIKLGTALGAEPLTFAGLAGMGDLVLTCTGGLSRNRRVGIALGEGKTLQEILDNMRMVAEGVRTAKAVHALLAQHDINAPICNAVYDILYQDKAPQDAVKELTSMELNKELGSLLQPAS
jgi:glycerol-3-phosphate dehydrogenase (NAD(P)+)